MEILIQIKDINQLGPIAVAGIMARLSWPDSNSASSIQKELTKRYIDVQPGPHPKMALALIWFNDTLAGWVGTRPWPEKFKGDLITAQTIECFVAPEHRRRGFGRMGLQALIATDFVDRDRPVSVYAPEAVQMAEKCGCKIVLLCEAT